MSHIVATSSHAAASPWKLAWLRLTSRWLTVIAMVSLVLLIIACWIGPSLSPWQESMQDLKLGAQPPSAQHWLGTDSLGRDVATRLLYGGRVSLLVGALATAVAIVIGVSYGLLAGMLGGRMDAVMMRVVDILYAFPFMTFVIILTVVFGRSFFLLFAAIGAVEWLTMARIVRGQVLVLREMTFVTAARAMGQSPVGVLRRHLLPNLSTIILTYLTLTIPAVILDESFLSFLGLGIEDPAASWGSLLKDGAQVINPLESKWWLLVFPALLMSASLLALNFLGDGLRDAFDPKSGD